ncbi:MAG: ribosome-associated translation inhibitor RaiA [Planctomycetota bacterium]|nr:ribosome-associated translation inhibitor RaiA [Planctomycetota bacterium]
MQIEVTVRHTSVSPELKAYAEKKAEHLSKFYDKIQSIRVLLDQSGAGFNCEILVDIEHMHELVVSTGGPDLKAAIDQSADRMERQLVDHKDRIRNRKGRGPSPHQPSRT